MKAIRPGDFSETEVVTNRQFTLHSTSSLLTNVSGERQTETFYIASASQNDNGVYKGPLYGSIRSQFYNQEYKPETTLSLNDSFNAIHVSSRAFNQKIKEGSVVLTDTTSSQVFVDDLKGNLTLSGSATHVGNVFYEFGTIVITDTGSYQDIGTEEYTLSFKSVYKKKTIKLAAHVNPNEFNTSTNPTARLRGDTTLIRPRYTYDISEVSASYSQSIDEDTIIPEFFGFEPSGSISSSLSPYVTSIGWFKSKKLWYYCIFIY
jgi:hypothetical protein